MNKEARDALLNRLKRCEGQLKAVQRMLEDEKQDPKQIMIQVSAAIASLENTKISLVEEFTKDKLIASIQTLSELLK